MSASSCSGWGTRWAGRRSKEGRGVPGVQARSQHSRLRLLLLGGGGALCQCWSSLAADPSHQSAPPVAPRRGRSAAMAESAAARWSVRAPSPHTLGACAVLAASCWAPAWATAPPWWRFGDQGSCASGGCPRGGGAKGGLGLRGCGRLHNPTAMVPAAVRCPQARGRGAGGLAAAALGAVAAARRGAGPRAHLGGWCTGSSLRSVERGQEGAKVAEPVSHVVATPQCPSLPPCCWRPTVVRLRV